MRNFLLLFVCVSFLFACTSSSKLLEKGKYDAAMKKAAKKIKKNPGKFKEVDVFNDAFRMAYNKDNDEVIRLKKSGDPKHWDRIYYLLNRMKKRQELAQSLPPVGITFEERDYDQELKNAKTNAAEYAYALGVQYLGKNNRFDARKAFAEFTKVKGYESNFRDVDDKINESRFLGMTNVLFRIENNSKAIIPENLSQELTSMNVNDLDKGWLNYDSYIDTNLIYHYQIILNMTLIDVSPEGLKETNYSESRDIKDGFEYVLDENGNVKKDSLGNDIKVPKYKTITCHVKEFHQKKTARISGTLDYYDIQADKMMKNEPITSDAHFEHLYAIANGDLAALKPETKKKIGIDPLPFPPDDALVYQAGVTLKGMTKEIINKNKNYLK